MLKRRQLMSRYLATVILFVAFWVFMVGLVNFIVDPKDYLGTFNITKLNAEKYFANGDRLEKSLHLKQDKLSGIIAGTSRTQIGIDPQNPLFQGKHVYNAGLSATNFFEIEKLLMFSLKYQDPDWLVLGLDFLLFSDRRAVNEDFCNSFFAGPQRFWFIPYIFNSSNFKDSLLTIYKNIKNEKKPHSDRFGFLDKDGTNVDHRKLFNTILTENFLISPETYGAFNYSSDRLNRLKNVINAYNKQNIPIYLFISPMHARHLEAIKALGLWDLFESWKRDLVEIVTNIKTNAAISLWDFSGYNSVTTEAVPDSESELSMEWYWESSHYKKSTGNMIVQKLFGVTDKRDVPDDFGVRLDGNNIDQILASIRQLGEKYTENNPAEVKDVINLTEHTKKVREKNKNKVRNKKIDIENLCS